MVFDLYKCAVLGVKNIICDESKVKIFTPPYLIFSYSFSNALSFYR
jgi:hypothetical protein